MSTWVLIPAFRALFTCPEPKRAWPPLGEDINQGQQQKTQNEASKKNLILDADIAVSSAKKLYVASRRAAGCDTEMQGRLSEAATAHSAGTTYPSATCAQHEDISRFPVPVFREIGCCFVLRMMEVLCGRWSAGQLKKLEIVRTD